MSNQKYRQFRASLGAARVGIITGDVVINKSASVLMMTTEIYRNMVLADPSSADGIHYVIFDEIHYIDSDRGIAWEESLIFAPPHVKFLGLSATIGNLQQFVDWLSEVRQEPVALVEETQRTVPLLHRYYNAGTGMASWAQMQRRRNQLRATDHRHLVRAMRNQHLPALMFVFSRRQCVQLAQELLHEPAFLQADELLQVQAVIEEYQGKYGLVEQPTFRLLARLLQQGIAFHHAGLLPVYKDLVEDLFERGLVKVLYCTETFAVGVNYPVKSVCFLEWQKYDGTSVRPLTGQEYLQMSGRAGRRGIDTRGFVFMLVKDADGPEIVDYARQPVEPIGSQYRLSCNSILNLLKRGMEEQVAVAYRSSFAHYLIRCQRLALEEQLAALQQRQAELIDIICDNADEASCPINRQRMQSKLGGLQKEWRRYRRRSLRRQCDRLRAQLRAHSPKACSQTTVQACRRARRQLAKVSRQQESIRQGLAQLPTAADWLQQYQRIRARLTHLGYIEGDQILPRGELASQINFQEILITEFVFAGMLDELKTAEICALLTGVDYVGRYDDLTIQTSLPALSPYFRIADELKSDQVLGASILYSAYVAPLGYAWANGCNFEQLMELTTIEEGDVVNLLRRCIDVLRQLRKSLASEPFWGSKLAQCLAAMERDVVAVDL